MNKSTTYLLWAARIVAAVIMLQTLFFKFTGASESVYIFSTLGVEPWGRIGSGIVELIASSLILIPRTSWIGAGLALGVMSGAILAHLTILGIPIQGDGGYLFILALSVAASSVTILYITRTQWLLLIADLLQRTSGHKPANVARIKSVI